MEVNDVVISTDGVQGRRETMDARIQMLGRDRRAMNQLDAVIVVYVFRGVMRANIRRNVVTPL